MVEGCFTDVVPHSSKSHHPEQVKVSRRLLKYVLATWGAVMLSFHGVFLSVQVISMNKHCCTLVNTNSCHAAHHIQYRASSSAASELG